MGHLAGDERHEDVLCHDGGLRVGPRPVLLAHPELGQVLPPGHGLQLEVVISAVCCVVVFDES